MLKLLNKNRIKIGLAVAALLFCVFIIPKAADALAYTSANLIKTETVRLLADGPATGGTAVTPDSSSPIEIDDSVKLLLDIMKILSLILQLLARILWPIIFLCGALMENDIIFGGAMGERLHDIWIQIRNIANLAFVLMLVGTAIYNISGFAGEKFQLKQMLPKIIMGLILVNFSYMISTVVLDAISVGTTAMFGIPRAVEITMTNAKDEPIINDKMQQSLCKSIGADKNTAKDLGQAIGEKQADAVNKVIEGSNNVLCEKQADGSFLPSTTLKSFIGDWAPHSATVIMAVEMMHMQNLQDTVMEVSDPTISSLSINMLFSIVMFFIYGMAFVVMFVVLLMRAIMVWLAVVLSPLLVLIYVVPEIAEKAGGNMKEVVGKVISISTAPMVIGFVLSIGFIMMRSLGGVGQVGEGAKFKTLLQDTLSFGTSTSGLANFQELMIAIGTVGFIWAGIKAATDKTIASGAANAITGFVQKSGSWLATAPIKYLPIFPVPGGSHEGKESIGTMLKVVDKAIRAPELASDEAASKMAQRMGIERESGSLSTASMESELSKIKQSDSTAQLDNLVVRIKNPEDLTPGVAKGIEEGIKRTDAHSNGHKGDGEAQDAYNRMLEISGKLKGARDPEEVKKLQQEMMKAINDFRSQSVAGQKAYRDLNTGVKSESDAVGTASSSGTPKSTQAAVDPDALRASAVKEIPAPVEGAEAKQEIQPLYSVLDESEKAALLDKKAKIEPATAAKIQALNVIQNVKPDDQLSRADIVERIEKMQKILDKTDMTLDQQKDFIKKGFSAARGGKSEVLINESVERTIK